MLENVGRKINIDEVKAGLLPKDKLQIIEDLKIKERKFLLLEME